LIFNFNTELSLFKQDNKPTHTLLKNVN